MRDAEVVAVRFVGRRSGTYDLTWAQKWLWRAVASQAPHIERLNVPVSASVPSGAELTDVLVALAALLERHEALRTRCYVDERGVPRQAVAGAGELPVSLQRVDGGDADECAIGMIAELAGVPFTVPELPIRVGVVVAEGQPVVVVLIVFHMSIDGWGTRVVANDLDALMYAIVQGRSFPPAERVTQTVDRLMVERRDAGNQAAASARYWAETVTRFPPTVLPAGTASESRKVQELELSSLAFGAATRSVATCQGVMRGTVVLVLVAELLAEWSGQPGCGLMIFSHNRFDEFTRNLSGTMAQSVPVYLDVEGYSFNTRLRTAHRAALVACANGQFDPDDIERVLADHVRHTGIRPDLGYAVNLFLPDDTDNVNDVVHTPEQIEEMVAESSLVSVSPPDWEDMTFYLSVKQASRVGLSVSLRFDTSVIPPARATRFLRDLEKRAIAAVTGLGLSE